MLSFARAFEYFVVSRALYTSLRDDYQLPSVRTLTKLTSKASKFNDGTFIQRVFEKLDGRQRSCILMMDEVYVKTADNFHGGTIFGQAQNKPDKLAKTSLAVMIKCLFGGPTFIVKMIPVYKLDSNFQFGIVCSIIESISVAGGRVIAIVCDNNRVNEKTFNPRTYNEVFLTSHYILIVCGYFSLLIFSMKLADF